MLDSHKYISSQIEREIPQFIRMEYPNFVAFIKAYYEWMEKQGAPYHFIANALNFSDVDRTSLQLLDEFGKNFLSPLPSIIYEQNNIATLIKNINQYYSARGSEKAFQFLFRLFQYQGDKDHDLEFYYPSYDMLRISDGKWVNELSIKIIDPPDNVMAWEAGELYGEESGTKAIIDEIQVYESETGIKIAELFLIEFDIIHTTDKFICGETIKITTKEFETYYASIEHIFSGVEITDPGKYYSHNQRIHVDELENVEILMLEDGSFIELEDGQILNSEYVYDGEPLGENARLIVDRVSKGKITGFTVINGGTGYQVNDKITVEGEGFGTGAYGSVTEVGSNGEIISVNLSYGGHDYDHNQKVIIDSKNGLRAVIMIESDDIGGITDIEVRNFGINYYWINTQVIFNTVLRIYDIAIDGEIGEQIIGQTSGAKGIVEYWDKKSNTISVFVTLGEFIPGEQLLGERWNGTATIYDIYKAKGKVKEGCLCRYKGRYINMDGHISSLKYIQDSYFYQMFSYMLKTGEDKENWMDYIKHVHPAGTIGFSYRDIVSQYLKESYGGFICPHLDTTEFYKFRWQPDQYHGGHIRWEANTQMKQYKNIVIDEISNININKLDKTGYTYGSEITIT
jgi:hypothetical protein